MSGNLLAFDESIFREDFGVRPFRVRHGLAGHPFLSVERLVDVLPRLPDDRIEYNAGDAPVNATGGAIPRTALSPEETVRRIERERSWMVLKNVELDPWLNWLLQRVLDEVAASSERAEPGMCAREGFVFVSSPGAVTPYHIDPEHNFLLQVRGSKTVHVFDGSDRSVLPDVALERFYTGGGRNLAFHEPLQARARTFALHPGDGLYIPVTHPHWVKNGSGPSVSFSVTFRTAATDARERLYKMNAKLRALGLPSRTPGPPAIDRAKLLAFDIARAAKRFFSHEPAFEAV